MIPAVRPSRRCAAELAAPQDQRFIEQATGLEIADERCDRPVGVLARAMSILDVGVVVPRLAVAVEDLDHADAPFDQPPSGQAGLGEVPLAVRLADTDRFAADVKGVLGVRLHPIGDLERLDAGIELVIARPRPCGASSVR